MIEWLGLAMIAIGVTFDLLGCIGMARFPNIYTRLQAGTKCVTLGVCLILMGTMVMATNASMLWKSLLCIVFILITSPTAAHALARAAKRSGIPLWDKAVVDQYEAVD